MRTIVALAAIAAATVECGAAGSRSGPPRPNVLLVTIDTLRADRIGAGIAPALDRLAASGLQFTNARSAVPLTLPSHTTILTGLLPPAHGVRQNGVDALGPAHPTIAKLLKDAGYRTAAFVGAFVLDRRFGLSQGFDVYDDRIPRDPSATDRLEAERPAQAVVDRALAWLEGSTDQRPTDQRPFFAWIHLYDPHAPYNPPAEFLRRVSDADRATSTPRYDAEIAYADSQIARVLEWIKTRGLSGRTLIVFAGDHGEGLGEHGESTHGMLLYDSTLRVPLAIAGPTIPIERRTDAVSLTDLAPTILAAAGLAPSKDMRGHDLIGGQIRLKADATADRGTDDRHVRLQPDLYAETQYPQVAGWSPLYALTDGRWKAIRADAATELYDLANDPREERDLSAAQSTTAKAMAARMDAIHARGATAQRTISAEAQERLRSLGYVASSAQPTPSASRSNPASTIATWDAFEEALAALNAGRAGAAQQLAKLAADRPDAPVFQSTYARALKDAGRIREALDVYRRAAKRWPTDATLLHDLAAAAREASLRARGGDAEALRQEALNADRAALVLEPESAMAHNGLGLLAADEGRHADAAREFEQATELDSNNASYWVNLGNARRAAGDAAGAEQAYRRALDADPSSADAANGRGVLLVEAKKPAEAAPWFERALTNAPDFVEARLNLAIALQQSGDAQRAADAYRAVLAARGDHAREKNAARKLLAAMGARP